jgi:hypothetical protein
LKGGRVLETGEGSSMHRFAFTFLGECASSTFTHSRHASGPGDRITIFLGGIVSYMRNGVHRTKKDVFGPDEVNAVYGWRR